MIARTFARLLPPALGFLLLGGAALAQEGGKKVDLELCLAVDGSGSIQEDEFAFQRQAYAQAVSDPQVVGIMTSGFEGSVAIALMEWGGPDSMHPIVDWSLIDSPESAGAFADAVVAAPRRAFGWNSISNAIAFCQQWMEGNGFDGYRRVIDVSGDAGQRGGMPLPLARELALGAGIVINGLALHYRSGGLIGPGGTSLVEHYRRDVIGGMGAFAIAVEQEAEFVDALIRKLILEIAWEDRERGAAASAVSPDVALELFDSELLLVDDGLDQIADGHDADQLPLLQDRHMAEPLVGHDCHALVHRLLRPHEDHLGTHDVADRGGRRRPAF
jgi:hypothetical protein